MDREWDYGGDADRDRAPAMGRRKAPRHKRIGWGRVGRGPFPLFDPVMLEDGVTCRRRCR